MHSDILSLGKRIVPKLLKQTHQYPQLILLFLDRIARAVFFQLQSLRLTLLNQLLSILGWREHIYLRTNCFKFCFLLSKSLLFGEFMFEFYNVCPAFFDLDFCFAYELFVVNIVFFLVFHLKLVLFQSQFYIFDIIQQLCHCFFDLL